jgi:D-inositol-3-phosphate glycosyltransferase
MKSLFLPHIPADVETLKDQNAENFPIAGSGVYVIEVLKALLRYSTYDSILLPAAARPPRCDLGDIPLFAENASRIKFVSEQELTELQKIDHLVLASMFIHLHYQLQVRHLSRRPRTPITGVIHSNHAPEMLQAILPFIFSPFYSFDALICSSAAGQQTIKNFMQTISDRLNQAGLGDFRSPFKMPIIPLGVDTARFANNCKSAREWLSIGEGLVLLYLGRMSPTIKADLYPLILAFSELVRDHPTMFLVLAGDDTSHRMAKDLEAFASELGCQGQVRIVPNPTSAQKCELYAAGDVFVSPADSLQETFGTTLAEAMSAGLPVVASDWSGYRDLVTPGQTGYLVPTLLPRYSSRFDDIRGTGGKDNPDLLAATTVIDPVALKQMLGDLAMSAERRREFGLAGQKRARTLYDWSVVIKRYEELWEELVEEAAAAPLDNVRNKIDLAQYGYQEVFGHYPTAFLPMDTRVALSALGRQWRENHQLLGRIASLSGWFREEGFSAILEFLNAKADASISDILSFHGSESEDDSIRPLGHLSRLLKYGLVERI